MIVFYNIVESGSISLAADRLNLSKSVISQQLKDLEERLGVTLLNRNTRKQELTNAGEVFYQDCIAINNIASSAWSNAKKTKESIAGTIRISAPNALIDNLVAPVVSQLLKKSPLLSPVLIGDDSRSDLIKEKIDLTIRVGESPSSSFKQQRIGSFRDILCANPELIADQGLTESLLNASEYSDIDINYVANFWQGKNISHTFKNEKKQILNLQFKASRRCNSLHSVLALARAGCGLAFIPDFIFNKNLDKLSEVLPGYHSNKVNVYMIYPHNSYPPMAVRECMNAIKGEAESLFI